MKLSEAIRAGAKIRPQAYGSFHTTRSFGNFLRALAGMKPKAASCALGAAYEAGGLGSRITTSPIAHRTFRGSVEAGETVEVMLHPDEWNAVFYLSLDCPQCDTHDALNKLIPHLNDTHRWTREEIALFVERLERVAARREREASIPMFATPQQAFPAPEDEVLDAIEIG